MSKPKERTVEIVRSEDVMDFDAWAARYVRLVIDVRRKAMQQAEAA